MINKEKILEITKNKTITKLQAIDQKIINLSQIIDKLPNSINELFEEFRILSDQEFPTVNEFLTIKEYCELYSLKEINKESLEEIIQDKQNIFKILIIVKSGVSIKLEPEIKKITNNLSKSILELIKTKEDLEKEISELFKKYYPNTYKIATPKIAYKMLEISGSFERLARFPASTIQLIGSEKSFFKALKNKKNTPKYGIIYNHPLLIKLQNKNKGKMARTLAAKISLAIKADLEGKDISKELEEKLNKKLSELK